jgi:N-acyl-D-aspartate/D-glutamate deacylase
MHELVIRGGMVVDGTGSPRRPADVAIDGGRLTAIGADVGDGRRTIDADGLVVAPGFVDLHTHFDAQGFWDPYLTPSPLHGVTTVVGGNCGFALAPLTPDATGYLRRMFARVEGIPLDVLESAVPWDWANVADFFSRLDGTLAVNAGFLVGHSALRRVVMGEAAAERTATDEEIAAIGDLLRAGLGAGGLGFSTGTGDAHNDAEGRPVPSRHAELAEFTALASICGDYAGTSIGFNPSIAINERDAEVMLAMTVAARRPVNWNVLMGWAAERDDVFRRLALSDRAAAAGGKIVALTLPRMEAARLTFHSGFILDAIDGWGEAMTLPLDEKMTMLSSPEARNRLGALAASTRTMVPVANWPDKVIVQTFTEETKRYEGRRVGDIAAEERKSPFDALLDIVVTDGLRTSFVTPRAPITDADWDVREALWRDPRTVIGGSDAGAHLDMMSTFTYTTDLFKDGVREQGRITTEEAVKLLAADPARLYGLVDRGVLAEGAAADVVVFDETMIAPAPVTTRFDLPGGGARLHADAIGIQHVLVNGQPIVSDRELTGTRPGVLLRGGRDSTTPSLSFDDALVH